MGPYSLFNEPSESIVLPSKQSQKGVEHSVEHMEVQSESSRSVPRRRPGRRRVRAGENGRDECFGGVASATGSVRWWSKDSGGARAGRRGRGRREERGRIGKVEGGFGAILGGVDLSGPMWRTHPGAPYPPWIGLDMRCVGQSGRLWPV